MDIRKFKDNFDPNDFARPSLFEVVFHNLGEEDSNIMKFLCCSIVHMIYIDTHAVEFELYEREDGFVEDRLPLLQGKLTIREYTRTGKYRDKTYQFERTGATTKMGWDMGNQVKLWTVSGLLK